MLATSTGISYVDMGTLDLTNWYPVTMVEGHFDKVKVEKNKNYIVGGGTLRLVLIDYQSKAIFWTLKVNSEDRILELRP
jgi:hypothetical protein